MKKLIMILVLMFLYSNGYVQPSRTDSISSYYPNLNGEKITLSIGEFIDTFRSDIDLKWDYDDIQKAWVMKGGGYDKVREKNNKFSFLFTFYNNEWLLDVIIFNADELNNKEKFQFLYSLLIKARSISNNENKEQNQNITKSNEPITEKTISIIKNVKKSEGKNIAPTFFWTENGTDKSTKELKGKVLFINFWATWCSPCKKEMPDLSSINDEFKEKEFKMLGLCVSEDNSILKILEVLNSNPVSYTIIQGNDDLIDAFKTASGNNLDAVPTSFIIDKKGKIVEIIVGSRDKKYLMNKINQYLN